MTRKFHPRSPPPPRDPTNNVNSAVNSGSTHPPHHHHYSQSVNSSPAPSPSFPRRHFPHSSSSPRLHRGSGSGVSPIPHHILVQQRQSQPQGGPSASTGLLRVHFSSVHHRNLYIASRPLVFIFDLAGVGLQQLFIFLRTLLLLIWNPLYAVWNRRLNRSSQGTGQSSNNTTLTFNGVTSVNGIGVVEQSKSSTVVEILGDSGSGITTTKICAAAVAASIDGGVKIRTNFDIKYQDFVLVFLRCGCKSFFYTQIACCKFLRAKLEMNQ